jgi:hypothetical protein
MPLFVVDHHHGPGECPAAIGRGSELLAQVSTANAARHGVTIAAEALVDGAHRLILIVTAADDAAVERFLGFLRQCGDLHVMAASTAEAAVERGGCDLPPSEQTIRKDTSCR